MYKSGKDIKGMWVTASVTVCVLPTDLNLPLCLPKHCYFKIYIIDNIDDDDDYDDEEEQ